MEETARAIGHRLWVVTAMTSLMLFLIAGLTVMAQPLRASAAPLTDQVSVSTQDATATALDGNRRCYKQVYRWKHRWHKKWVCKHYYHKHHKKNYHHKNNWHYNNYDHHGGYHR
ncbi:hypothetical protein ACFQY4_12220 [Catellatospora bangladeshensis]|uniref:Uncharacterized protein n=1 Tax=Catellatospora bangladeshensis TaxID=310355 RepID=A0A8J3JQS4_9ACTN|nr:hypothetical protein [Catellatospora bangladeshensis]GIF85231.1 hypothetical protein Cba03nite_65800 [Catellatospora bangladeshensis]